MSDDTAVPTNPLVRARLAAGLSYVDYARSLHVHRALVQFAEQGCFRAIPHCYYRKNSGVTPVDSVDYALFRTFKRRRNFKRSDFPDEPPQSFKALLEHLDLNPYSFACRICVQYPETWKLYNNKHISRLPINVTEALLHVGLPLQWIQEFESNLRKGQDA